MVKRLRLSPLTAATGCTRWRKGAATGEKGYLRRSLKGESPGDPNLEKHNLILWLHGQAVKTQPSHGCNRGSNPLGVTRHKEEESGDGFLFVFYCCNRLHAAARWEDN